MLTRTRDSLLTIAAVAAVLVITACGGGSRASHSPTSQTPTSTTPTSTTPESTTPTSTTPTSDPVPPPPPVQAAVLTVTSPYALISVNEDEQLTATLALPDGSTLDVTADVVWSSSDASVASVSNEPGTNGLAVGVLAGSTLISASYTTAGETYASAPVPLSVQANAILRSIAISPENPTLTLGCNTVALAGLGVYGDDSVATAPMTGVSWSSADESVATVSADGVVSAVGLGTTTVTAAVDGFAPVHTTVTVTDTTVLSYVAVRPGSVKVGSPRLVTGVVAFSCPLLADTTVELSIANLAATEPAYAFFADAGGAPLPGGISLTGSGSTATFAIVTVNPNDGTFGAKRVKHRVEITAAHDPDEPKSALLRVRP